jgi:nitrate reductase gamma subunit
MAETLRTVLWVVTLAAATVFVAGSIARAVRYARQPRHLRWEVYPVPHEPRARARHGGSRYEETDWWTRPQEVDTANAARAMATEILLLRGLWKDNRALWYRSYPFHLGLYLVLAAATLSLLLAVLAIAWPGLVPAAVAGAGSRAAELAGTAGLALAVAGAAALLRRRLTDPALRPYTTAGDLFNLAIFVGAFGVLLGAVLSTDGPGAVATARAVLTLDGSVPVAAGVAVGLALSGLVAAWIPFTHMAHFVAKYFTYHAVRWDDAPTDGRIARAMTEYLGYRPTWSAPHVGADGTRTWAEVATTPPPAEPRS